MLTRHEDLGATDSNEYAAATIVFYTLHVCGLEICPHELNATFGSLAKDPIVYRTMNGPNEFHVIATWKTWSVIDQLQYINVSTLVLDGYYDEAQDETLQPFFRNIPKCSLYVDSRPPGNLQKEWRHLHKIMCRMQSQKSETYTERSLAIWDTEGVPPMDNQTVSWDR
ncbi:hypothetical protein BU17DRAFT_95505 [Hysterangium stoloniferum]|nr:hypothetical protein BU17DRAFT_95505 [Hysterangium stoloniferum]